ncbi:MAG: hypothetical protein L0H94_08485 [Nitrospira sp.]|nr:hypothetical protein [Nitrospira sp.]
MTLRTQPFADLLLAYISIGAIIEARMVAAKVLEKSDQMRGTNAVLVLGYFYLRCLELEQVQALLHKLDEMRGHLPDAQVIRGWCRLRGDPSALLSAQEAFVAAGLHIHPPVYTEGLRLLIDGLELFCSADGIERHPRLFEAAERVRTCGRCG